MIVAPSMTTATAGMHPRDAGVASALVNAMQQAGGCIGTAVLSTIAATATASPAPARSRVGAEAAAVVARAATHGFGAAFAASAGAFAVGALMAAALFPARTRAAATPPQPGADHHVAARAGL